MDHHGVLGRESVSRGHARRACRGLLAISLSWSGCVSPDEEPVYSSPATSRESPQGKMAHDVDRSETSPTAWIAVFVAEHRVDVAAPVAARLSALPVTLGAAVQRGQVIAELRNPSILFSADAAEASLQRARAELARIEVDGQHARRRHAQALALGAVASADEVADAAETLQRTAAAKEGAGAEVQRLLLEHERWREQHGSLTVRAEIEGTVALHHHDPGEWVGVGEPLVRIVSATTLLRVAVPIEDAHAVALGTRLEFVADDGEHEAEAVVFRIAPEVDDAGYVLLEARPLGASAKPGTPGRVRPVDLSAP